MGREFSNEKPQNKWDIIQNVFNDMMLILIINYNCI